MGLESASFISGLNAAYPEGSDQQSQGDDHLRLLKTVLKATFPDATAAFYFPKETAAFESNSTLDTSHINMFCPVNATGGAVTLTLPVTYPAGTRLMIMKIDSSVNAVTIAPSSGNINGASTLVLRNQYDVAICIWSSEEGGWRAMPLRRQVFAPVSLTSTTTLTVVHNGVSIEADATSAGFTITLPTTNIPTGMQVRITKIDATENVIAIASYSAYNLYNQGESILCTWNGVGWVIVGERFSSTADVWAGNVDRNLRSSDITEASALVTLTFGDPSTAFSWTGGLVRELTLSADSELANPTGGIPGTFRTIILKGSSSTERALTFGTEYGGSVPVIDDVTSTKWYALTLMCITASHFIIVGLTDASPPA